jgi:ATP-dependent RNA helicase DHX8/PRP22
VASIIRLVQIVFDNMASNIRQALVGGGGCGPLRIVVMSATLEASSFSDFFGGAPIVYSQGRKYPVEMFYTEEPEDDYLDAALVGRYGLLTKV